MNELHRYYMLVMGQPLPEKMDWPTYWMRNPQWQIAWGRWLAAGFTGPQLEKVLRYLRREIAAGRRNPGRLKLQNLLTPESFQDDLLLASSTFLHVDSKVPKFNKEIAGQFVDSSSDPSPASNPSHPATDPAATEAKLAAASAHLRNYLRR